MPVVVARAEDLGISGCEPAGELAADPSRQRRHLRAVDALRAEVLRPGLHRRPAERAKGQAGGLKTIESFHTHGTPPVA
jgi:2-methylaconitate cis-trans-isomerase PrpF